MDESTAIRQFIIPVLIKKLITYIEGWKMEFESRLIRAIRALNRHLPAERKTLATLLREDKPAVRGRDDTIQRIKKEELVKIASLIPEEYHPQLKLPIYIELTPDYGRGISRIRGRIECEVVLKLLHKPGASDTIFIYRDDIRRLRRELPTATQYAFVTQEV